MITPGSRELDFKTSASAVDCAKCELPVIDRAALEQHGSEKYDNSKCSKESENGLMFAIVLNVIGDHGGRVEEGR